MPNDGRPAATARIWWRTPDPPGVLRRLRPLGLHAVHRDDREAARIELPGLHVFIGPMDGPDERLEGLEWLATPRRDAPPGTTVPPVRTPAVGIATVDGERLVRQLGLSAEQGPDDEALGARSWRATATTPSLLVLEPKREGKVAASLARLGEGPVALYMALPVLSAMRSAEAGRLGPRRRWPGEGWARLTQPARPWGPFLLLVEDQAEGATTAPSG